MHEVELIQPLEASLPDPMLLGMVRHTKADHPAIGWLQPDPAVGAASHVRTFDRNLAAPGHAAMVSTNPDAVGETGATIGLLTRALDALWEKSARQEPAPGP